MEVFWTGFNSLLKGDVTLHGWTSIWMFPVYGLAVFFEPVHDRIREWPAVLRGGVYVLLIFAIEYATGTLFRALLGKCPWDYSGNIYSIHGIIRLDFAPLWFIAGLLFERLHDALTELSILRRSSQP